MSLSSWLDNLFDSNDSDSRQKMLRELKTIVESRERRLAEEFYKYGPDYLKSKVESQGGDFRKIYDSLITRQNILKRLTLAYLDFFVELVGKRGPNVMREVFKIEDEKYDLVFEELFDIVAVSSGALYQYLQNREKYLTEMLRDGGAIQLRADLGMVSHKYDELWLEIMDGMLDKFCDSYSDERVIDTGIRSLTNMLNATRQHRSLRSFGKMWEYSSVAD